MSDTDDKGLALSQQLQNAELGTVLRFTGRELDALSEYERRVLSTTARKYGWISQMAEDRGEYIYTRKYRRLG